MIDRAERRLNNLNYFKKVKITNEPGSAPDRIVLNVDVEEKSTGNLSLGGGYSTADGWLAEVSVTETNLMGRGQYARAAVQYGQYARGFELSFAEPYFLGYRVGAGIDLYARIQLANTYRVLRHQDRRHQFPAGCSRSTKRSSIAPRYSIYQQEITVPDYLNTCRTPYINSPLHIIRDCASTALSRSIANQAPGLTSAVGYTRRTTRSTTTRLRPRALFVEFKQDFAGVGGDVNFIRTSVDARHYAEVMPDVIGLLRLQGGIMTGWGGNDLRATRSLPGGSEHGARLRAGRHRSA